MLHVKQLDFHAGFCYPFSREGLLRLQFSPFCIHHNPTAKAPARTTTARAMTHWLSASKRLQNVKQSNGLEGG